MKRIISKMLLSMLLTLFVAGPLFAANAKVTYLKGKVEVNRNNAWVALKVGDEVKESETISTGFQSELRLNYNGSVMAVPALSRVTLETLKSTDTKETVSVKVDTGAIRSKVAHTDGKRIDYSTRTAVAVASVRGTDYIVFSTGKAKVITGAINYYKANLNNTKTGTFSGTGEEGSATATTSPDEISDGAPQGTVVVGAGQTSSIGKDGNVSKPLAEAQKRANKVKSTVSTQSDKEAVSAGAVSTGVEMPVDIPQVVSKAGISISLILHPDTGN